MASTRASVPHTARNPAAVLAGHSGISMRRSIVLADPGGRMSVERAHLILDGRDERRRVTSGPDDDGHGVAVLARQQRPIEVLSRRFAEHVVIDVGGYADDAELAAVLPLANPLADGARPGHRRSASFWLTRTLSSPPRSPARLNSWPGHHGHAERGHVAWTDRRRRRRPGNRSSRSRFRRPTPWWSSGSRRRTGSIAERHAFDARQRAHTLDEVARRAPAIAPRRS